MRIAIVVQRYGEQCVGGAERHASLLAKELYLREHDVKIYTTTATDYRTWADELPAGSSIEHGIEIQRFSPRGRRKPLVQKAIKAFLMILRRFDGVSSFLNSVILSLEKLWFVVQGPYVPELVDALTEQKDKHDAVLFFTYLYYPTVMGIKAVADKSILIPTAHDEFPFYFRTIRNTLKCARLVLANCEPEKKMIEKLHALDPAKIKVGAYGFSDGFTFSPEIGKGEDFLLYLGRISSAKNIDKLVAYFVGRYQRGKTDLKLYLAGKPEKDFNIPSNPIIRWLGVLSEEEKHSYLARCLAVINPSDYESLSMLVLEGIACGKQVIVNKHCDVLRYYCDTLDTVYGYECWDEVDEVLELRLNRNPSLIESKLRRSNQWLYENFTWNNTEHLIKTLF